MTHKKIILFLILSFSIFFYIISFIRIKNQILIVDEGNHTDQITRFVHGEFLFNSFLMTIPGYHFVMAVFVKMFKAESLSDIRLIALFLNILILPVYYLCARQIGHSNPLFKTLQFAYFPIIYPFYFLIYTDIFSLLLILAAFFFILRKMICYSN